MKSIDPKYLDQRTVRRYIQQGLIREDDYQKFLKSLPNDQENSEVVPFGDETEEKIEENPMP